MKHKQLVYAAGSIIDNITSGNVKIVGMTHPEYGVNEQLWYKWRLSYTADTNFVQQYLQQFSKRETNEDFEQRKLVTYVPSFAKAAINDIRNSIFQRISDVTREGGPESYIDSVNGLLGGVDLLGSTLDSYVGRYILPELLVMKKVGVYVDMPQITSAGVPTLADKGNKHPYLYYYTVEDILNWVKGTGENGSEFLTLLLRDHTYSVDPLTGMPIDNVERYRFIWKDIDTGTVSMQFFDSESNPINSQGELGVNIITLDIPAIPFVTFELSESLMADICDYQIALLNLASSDMSYVLKSNFPFYVEQFDPRSENLFNRTASSGVNTAGGTGGEALDAATAGAQEVKVGVSSGRRYPKGFDAPSFIHPSAEPLTASMLKQDELKRDIQVLLKLAVTNLAPKMASAESKGYDERGLEAGLSAIGLELEHGERDIARHWANYEGSGIQSTVKYPQKYSLESSQEKRNEAADTLKTAKCIPSLTYKKEALKQVTKILLGNKIALETLNTIQSEIDSATVIVSDPDELSKDIEQGIVSLETASLAKNYPPGEVEKAAKDHADRIERIAESQAQAKGVPEMGGLGNASKDQKQNTDMNNDNTTADEQTRGGASTGGGK